MYAHAIQEAEAQLVELRQDEVQRGGLGVAALGASIAATVVYPPLALPLFLGGLTIAGLAVRAIWGHWDLVDRLADDRDAYLIPEVRAYAARDARADRRLAHAELIRTWTGKPTMAADARVVEYAHDLEDLARDLEDERLELDPACALACRRLLSDATVSPLLNNSLPGEGVRPWILRIRAGFTSRCDASLD
jgi:hypothetical protein